MEIIFFKNIIECISINPNPSTNAKDSTEYGIFRSCVLLVQLLAQYPQLNTKLKAQVTVNTPVENIAHITCTF